MSHLDKDHDDNVVELFPDNVLDFPYFDKEGHELRLNLNEPDDLSSFNKIWDIKSRVVAQTYIGKTFISTVHLPINHRFSDGPPLIFETMVFDYESRYARLWKLLGRRVDEEFQWRYSTFQEAFQAHWNIVEEVRRRSLKSDFNPTRGEQHGS